MVALEVCKSFRRKPKRLAPVASQSKPPHTLDDGTLSPGLPPSRPAIPSTRSSARRKTYGLEILYDGRGSTDGGLGVGVDIVAIHGLNGNAHSTWRHSNGTLWLKDLLPGDLPNSRIYTYGYPAEVLFSKSRGDIVDYSRGLLSEVWGQLFEATREHVRPSLVCSFQVAPSEYAEKGAAAYHFHLP
ncbi:hypothetical protein BDV96DRAFT_106631 [Lophiotrema nucula]|uniref:Alpha/Beta hydrolase protein n=1 Tax=Lophiotrema nucula TaxID=690887 RepID=A0A6A5Z3M0_9PLEO|nr:hypothetical protein BDV96DRAFT_106631 [Lophiotrema nucula]